MDTPPEPPNEGSDALERIDSVEGRLDQFEDEQRLRAIEERVNGLEQDIDAGAEEGPAHNEGEGQKALRLAVAAMLNKDEVVAAVADLTKAFGNAVTEWSGLKARQLEAQKKVSLQTYYWGLAFSAFVLLFLGGLLWYDKISKELAAGLIGSLIGYWFGRHEKEKG